MLFNFFSKWTELTTTLNPSTYFFITESLKNAHIPYKTKASNIGHGNRRTGIMGSIGEQVEFETQYYIFVEKANVEYAKHICNLV